MLRRRGMRHESEVFALRKSQTLCVFTRVPPQYALHLHSLDIEALQARWMGREDDTSPIASKTGRQKTALLELLDLVAISAGQAASM